MWASELSDNYEYGYVLLPFNAMSVRDMFASLYSYCELTEMLADLIRVSQPSIGEREWPRLPSSE